jgi:glycosyltransferase involved in cell wall biosynthesis
VEKVTLLMILPHCSTGGLPQYAYVKVRELINSFNIYVIEWNDIAPIYNVQKNKLKELLPPENLITWPQGYDINKKVIELLFFINYIKPDIVHIEEFPEGFLPKKLIDSLYNEERKYRIIETTHDSSFLPTDKSILPDAFSFVSEYHIKEFSSLDIPSVFAPYPTKKHKRPDRIETLMDLNLDPSIKHVLNVGLFTPGKNQGEIFEIARKLKDEKIQFHFDQFLTFV